MGLVNKSNLLVACLVGGGLYYASHFYTLTGIDQLRVQPREPSIPLRDWTDPRNWIPVTHSENTTSGSSAHASGSVAASSAEPNLLPSKPVTPTIRLASFDLQNYDERKSQSVAVQEILARVLRNFDVVAIQGITSRQRDTLPKLIDRLNQDRHAFDYMVGPRVGPVHQSMHFAFIYNTDRVETDRYQLYTVEDPGELLDYDPLVGWFRSKAVEPHKALTFSFVNLYISPSRATQELNLLPAITESIQQDGRGEDDIILAGGFSCSDRQLGMLSERNWGLAIHNIPTSVEGDEMLDQIAFPPQTSDEFTGRSGVIDFLRKFNLTIQQANQVSSHLPVWCEFFAEEGGYPGYR